MTDQPTSHLGLPTAYPKKYAPEILQGIDRREGRQSAGVCESPLPFSGADIWTAYELSWLDSTSRPFVGIGEFTVACESPRIIESKSLKLYLNSLNEHTFNSPEEALSTLQADLSAVCGITVGIRLFTLQQYAEKGLHTTEGICLDTLEAEVGEGSDIHSECLSLRPDTNIINETLYSDLFKSNCPVTGQPDWASISISYSGRAIDHQSVLAYLLSFRRHEGFHEECLERIFVDISAHCQPEKLLVVARYTRRGGIDINPWRSSEPKKISQNRRLARQ